MAGAKTDTSKTANEGAREPLSHPQLRRAPLDRHRQDARISGWVHRVRDHGGVLFIDLRDHYGLTQVVADPDSKAFKTAESLRSEWVVQIEGQVRERPAGTTNADLPTGEIELYATAIDVLSEAKELPVPVFGEPDYPEDLRLTYRFLDLRRETLHGIIMKRLEITKSIRAPHACGWLQRIPDADPHGLVAGRRPRLPRAVTHSRRQILRPSPGTPAVQAAVDGLGLRPLLPDCPLLPRRRPARGPAPGEFYQLDVEMSFVEQEDIFQTMEPVITGVFEEFAKGRPVTKGWPRIPYDTAIAKYGSDKPDLRNPIEMADVTEHFRGSGFKVFAGMIEKDAKVRVWAIPAPGGGSRAFCDRMNSWAQKEGQPGLGYIFWREDEGSAVPAPLPRTSAQNAQPPSRRNSASRQATPASSQPATRRSSISSQASPATRSAASSSS